MASGQIDPARLQGEALRRWYLRSPEEIEEERRRAADRAYESFFGNSEGPPSSPRDSIADASPRRMQMAAASARGFWDYWSPKGCGNCHGYTPETLPPVGGHTPFPPDRSERRGGSDGSRPPKGEWSDRPQCNQQFEEDRRICRKAKSPDCWERSHIRLEHCDRTGDVSIPPLRFGPPGR
jgi:hypothetical protein